jgi:hypothetical protein
MKEMIRRELERAAVFPLERDERIDDRSCVKGGVLLLLEFTVDCTVVERCRVVFDLDGVDELTESLALFLFTGDIAGDESGTISCRRRRRVNPSK